MSKFYYNKLLFNIILIVYLICTTSQYTYAITITNVAYVNIENTQILDFNCNEQYIILETIEEGFDVYTFDGSNFINEINNEEHFSNPFSSNIIGEYIFLGSMNNLLAGKIEEAGITINGEFDFDIMIFDVWSDGTYIYAIESNKIQVFTFNEGTGFTSIYDNHTIGAFSIYGKNQNIYLYASKSSPFLNGVNVYEFDGSNLNSIGYIDNSEVTYDIWCDDQYIYLANGENGLRAYSFDGLNFQEIAHIDDGGFATDVWGDGQYIYLANGVDGLRVYELQGEGFIHVAHINDVGTTISVCGNSEYIYLISSLGLWAYKLEELPSGDTILEGHVEGTGSGDRKYFRYYIGKDYRGITIAMLVAPPGDGEGEIIEQNGFAKGRILNEDNEFLNNIYFIDRQGKIKKYVIE